MPSIGVRDLKNNATEIVRTVREEHVEYIVTYRGEPVAVLLPLDQNWQQIIKRQSTKKILNHKTFAEEMEALSEEIAHHWHTGLTAAEAVAEQRR